MHKTLRRALFWFFFLAFFAVGTLLLVKTQGFVFDWKDFTFTKTGGIFIRSVPGDGKILINGKPYKRPVSLFNKGVLIKDLAPASYDVRVEQIDRTSWEKTLIVEPGLVAAASFIRLFPEKAEESPLSPRIIENFWLVKGGVVLQSGGILYFGETKLKGSDVVESFPDRGEIITKDENQNLYLTSLSDPETATSLRALFASLAETRKFLKPKTRVESVSLHPFSPNSVIVRYNTGVFVLDTKKLTLERVIENSATGVLRKTDSEIFWVTATGTDGYNLVLGTNTSPIQIRNIVPESMKIDTSGNLFFFKDISDTLFEFDRSSATSTEIAKNVMDFSLSESKNRLLIIQNDGRALFYYLAEDTGDVKTPKGALKLFPIAKKSRMEDIKNVIWNGDIPEHVFFLKDGTLIGAETDIRAPVNAYSLYSDIKKVTVRDRKFIALKTDGTLVELEFKF